MAYPKKTESRSGMYHVYMHTMIPTGKRYIGCTGQEPTKRFQNGYGYEKCTEFFPDIVKYGWQSVETTILAETEDFELACSFEAAAIERYQTTDSRYGYNLWSSGTKNTPNEKVGKRISQAKMGHSVKEETRQKLREVNSRPCVCLDLEGNFVAEYPSITEAAKAVNLHKTNIWAVCKGRKKTARGFKWVMLEDYISTKEVL